MFKVTKRFTSGLLRGMETTEKTTVHFPVGFVCKKPIGGSAYVVTACEPVEAPRSTFTIPADLFVTGNHARSTYRI